MRRFLALTTCTALSLGALACGEVDDKDSAGDSTVEADADADTDADTDTDADADADSDTDTDTDTDTDVDADGDGFSPPEDCDDDNKQINPDANEVCDREDNDCDDSVDEGVTNTYYQDEDGDGWGLEDVTMEDCAETDGWASQYGDCNDDDKAINPDAEEKTDTEVDEDCDGDDGTGGSTSTYTWSDMESLWSSKCGSCHWGGSSGGFNFQDGYTAIVTNGGTGNSNKTLISTSGNLSDSHVWTKVNNGSMPKNGSLTTNQKNQIKTYLEEGAPKN